jgi:REP element-mobilizing transposase RayT
LQANKYKKQTMMAEAEKWQWQEPGTAWKGAALYHVTLTVTDRQAVLGRLDIPDDNPAKARVRRPAFGDALVDCLMSIPAHHPEVRVLHFCLMPDHLHAVLYVQRRMEKGVGALVRGFWQATKKLGRASTYAGASFICPNDIRGEYGEGKDAKGEHKEDGGYGEGKTTRGVRRGGLTVTETLKDGSRRLQEMAASLREQLGDDAYYQLGTVFCEMPFIRAMSRYSQLSNTIRYLDMNPQRLATKRLKPGFFRVQKDIEIGGRRYDGVGNVALLHEQHFDVVHVRSIWVKAAEHGDSQALRDYKNGCVLKARKGVVMVSPFISPDEKQVMQVLLREQLPFVLLTDNGFRDYYKPADTLFDACAAGRLLILSPWPFDGGKRHISRADCVALNDMAEEICNQ